MSPWSRIPLRILSIALLPAALLVIPLAIAHHGWGWASDELTELTGEITRVRLGNPHGEVGLNVNGEEWTVEVGQPWRNLRAGLEAEMLVEGRTITILGNPSAREGERLIKAVRVTIDGTHHDLYPNRVPDDR